MTDAPADDRVLEAIERRRQRVNEAVPEELPVVPPERLYRASRHLLDAGGKRLRPAVLLLVAEALGDMESPPESYREFPDLRGGTVDVMAAGISIEIIHLFTLIHDDIMDDDDLRRGVPAVHREFDMDTAILAGDTLYSKAFEAMLRTGAPADRTVRAMDTIATTCTEICEGQALDIEFEGRGDVTLEEYLEMIRLKTAVLYGAAASVPALVVGADDETVEALYQYGVDVGRGFQIQDDVLDLTASSETLGKRHGSDLVEGKRTAITLHARDQGVDVDALLDFGDPEDVSQAEIDDAVETLQASGSIRYAREKAEEFIENGKRELEVLPDNEPHDLLAHLADYLIERGY